MTPSDFIGTILTLLGVQLEHMESNDGESKTTREI
jgi:hypothetical protein